MAKKHTNLGGREIPTKEKRVNKKLLIALIAAGLAVIVAGVILLTFALRGRFDKEEAVLYKRTAETEGFYKFYIVGDDYKGTYATMVLSDGVSDFEIEMFLLSEYAPITVANFIEYANEGFYDGTAIHRIVASTYTLQGGGYTYDTTAKKYAVKANEKQSIDGEFKNNTTGDYDYNTVSHFAGSISMARSTDKNSATSQWFISWASYPKWDGDYAAFGFIIDSEDVKTVKALGENTKVDSSNYPTTVLTVKSVMITEK